MTLPVLKSRTLIVFICLVFAACAALALLQLKTGKHPLDAELDAPARVGRETPLYVRLAGTRLSGSPERASLPGVAPLDEAEVEIFALQGETRERLRPFRRGAEPGRAVLAVSLAETSGLRDGEFQVAVRARRGRDRGLLDGLFAPSWSVHSFVRTADFTPPSAALFWSPRVLKRGGAALLRLEPDEAVDRLRLSAGRAEYTVFQAAPGRYAALVAFPAGLHPEDYRLELRLTDPAGNSGREEIAVPAEDFQFRNDPIRLTDKFLNKKYREFKDYLGEEGPPLELFLSMNRRARAANYRTLAELCRNGAPAPLWEGPFLEMPNATRRSEFADRRDYVYKKEAIDRQVHLGLDYASVIRDAVPATNGGVVAFTGYLGIHGNAVLIDHGLGLFSLYSHLSEIGLKAGDRVKKGEIVGRTGSSGMAGGDHLHFEILVNGVSVNPDYFFDAAWLERNIDGPLAELTRERPERS